MSLLLSVSPAPAVHVRPLEIEQISTTPATATITFGRSGVVTYNFGTYNWYTTYVLNVGDQYEILAEVSTVPSSSFIGTTNVWIPMTSDRSWTLTKASGTDVGSLLVSIRKVGEPQVMSAGLVVFIVEVIA